MQIPRKLRKLNRLSKKKKVPKKVQKYKKNIEKPRAKKTQNFIKCIKQLCT